MASRQHFERCWLLLSAENCLRTWSMEPSLRSSQEGWGLAFCKTCGTTLCGTHLDKVHDVTLGSVNGDPGVEIAAHIFVGSKAPWDHIGGSAPQYDEWKK